MSNFKQMMKDAYVHPSVDDLRLRKMQNNILARIERIDEKRQTRTWFQMARVAAVFALVFISYHFLQQAQIFVNDNQIFAKIDVLANEAVEQKQDVSQTIISYQSQEDMYLEMMHKRLAKLQQEDKERLLKEIF